MDDLSVSGRTGAWRPPDARRALQLCLAAIWLLDAILQFQPTFFTKAFATGMIAPTASGNPSTVAHSITWAAGIIGHHPAAANTPFALVQLCLALGIAWRRTVKPALAASVLWSLGVWWFGEGLGGVLNGVASPLNGAPGAVLIYALLAVLLWPVDASNDSSRFVAAGLIGERAAGVVWVVVWGALAFFAVNGANRSPDGLHNLVGAMTAGEPGWLVAIDTHTANFLQNRGLAASIAIAGLLVLVALRAVAPDSLAKGSIVLGVVAAAGIWVVGEDFGTILAGGATDPNSGPLLIVLALAYWPRRAVATAPSRVAASLMQPALG
jgi:hypothetical protein